jgi:hypothetical protein
VKNCNNLTFQGHSRDYYCQMQELKRKNIYDKEWTKFNKSKEKSQIIILKCECFPFSL